MHTALLILVGFVTLLLAGPALLRRGLTYAWLMTAVSVIPVGILYMAFRGENAAMYLWPAFIMLSISTYKAAVILLRLYAETPESVVNAPVAGTPHWAA